MGALGDLSSFFLIQFPSRFARCLIAWLRRDHTALPRSATGNRQPTNEKTATAVVQQEDWRHHFSVQAHLFLPAAYETRVVRIMVVANLVSAVAPKKNNCADPFGKLSRLRVGANSRRYCTKVPTPSHPQKRACIVCIQYVCVEISWVQGTFPLPGVSTAGYDTRPNLPATVQMYHTLFFGWLVIIGVSAVKHCAVLNPRSWHGSYLQPAAASIFCTEHLFDVFCPPTS